MALQEKHILISFVDFVTFFPGTTFVRGTFEDFPVSDKICKSVTNHLNLLSIGEDRKFCLNK